jgi:predicted kinase
MDFLMALSRGEPTIVVDNTNVAHRDYENYVQMAEDAGYDVIIDTVETDLTAEELAERNTHGVPADVIEGMMRRWEP